MLEWIQPQFAWLVKIFSASANFSKPLQHNVYVQKDWSKKCHLILKVSLRARFKSQSRLKGTSVSLKYTARVVAVPQFVFYPRLPGRTEQPADSLLPGVVMPTETSAPPPDQSRKEWLTAGTWRWGQQSQGTAQRCKLCPSTADCHA